MCGIVGYWNKSNNLNIDLLNENVSNMAKTLHHRGPDDTGVWVDPSSGIALGHRRLSIIDIVFSSFLIQLSCRIRIINK